MLPFSPRKQEYFPVKPNAIVHRTLLGVRKFTSSSFFSCCSLVVLSFCRRSRSRSLSDSFCFFSRTLRSNTSSISLSILFNLATCSFCSSSIMNRGFLLGTCERLGSVNQLNIILKTLSVPATPASFLHLKFS